MDVRDLSDQRYSASRSRNDQARLRRIATLFAVLIALLFAAKVAQTLVERAGAPVADLVSYYDGAQRLRAGLPLYRPDFDLVRDGAYQFIYPPLLAFLLLPMPTYQVAWWGWAAFSIFCWLLALALLLRELRGDLRLRVSAAWWPVLLAALINFPPVLSHLFWGQLQLLLLLILTCSWLCLRRGRDGAAGVLLGRVLPEVNHALGQYSPGNNSIASAIRNAIGDGALADGLGLVIRAAIVVAVALGAWRLRGDPARAFALGVTALVLVPPVIWEHYFVLAYLPWLDALARMRRRQAAPLALAYFLIATASLAYHTPANILFAVQLLPLGGALLLLIVQLQDALGRPGTCLAAAPQNADIARE